MLRAIGIPLMCLAMFSIAGGHWAVVQTVAWAQMLKDYSANSSFSAAVEKTFSGKAPCAMCNKIVSAKQQEQKTPATLKSDKKAEGFLSATVQAPIRSLKDFRYDSPRDTAFAARADSPDGPVPRSAIS